MGVDVPVVIVGGGPTGLMLGAELTLAGIGAVIVERRASQELAGSRAGGLHARTIEVLDQRGVADRFVSQGQKHPALHFHVPLDISDCPTRHNYVLGLWQNHIERILAEWVEELGTPIHRARELTGFTQDADGVDVRLSDGRRLRAQYLVGCDGPSGIVRDALGIGIEGIGAIAHSVNLFFRTPELATSHDKGWARFYRVIDETGCWGELIPIDGKELWRLTVFDEPLSKADPDFLLRKMTGGPFPYEMISVSPWERRDYVARSYGQGRVLIAGDAAHECSPTGGIGMHTGLEEAVNLGWKLAALTEGWGGPALLASYEIERRPIAVRNVGLATRSYNAIAAIPGWREGVTDWKANPAWLSIPEHMKLHYSYDGSPVCVSDGTPPVPMEAAQVVPTTRPGTRAPHAWLDGDRSTLDLFGDGFVLLRLGAKAPDASGLLDAAKAQGVPMRAVTLADPDVATLYETSLVLVRPDGHVAWRGNENPADAAGIVNRIRGAASPVPVMAGEPRAADAPRAHLL
jgi:2-polyprenyl-6-methoxyphenol hydroxylase-like FAD-dependent oxidoreductase